MLQCETDRYPFDGFQENSPSLANGSAGFHVILRVHTKAESSYFDQNPSDRAMTTPDQQPTSGAGYLTQTLSRIFTGLAGFVLSMALLAGTASARDLVVLATPEEPYKFLEDGVYKGIDVEVLDEVMRRLGLSYSLELVESTVALTHLTDMEDQIRDQKDNGEPSTDRTGVRSCMHGRPRYLKSDKNSD